MKAFRSSLIRELASILPLLLGSTLAAAPLSWYPGPGLDSPRSGAATTVDSNGFNLLIGGDAYGAAEYLVQELGPANDYWTYPSVYYFDDSTLAGGAVRGGEGVIYYGGNNGDGATNAAFSYSPSDGISALPHMRSARAYFGYAPDHNGNAYAFGGLDANGHPLASAEYFNQDSNAWLAITSLPAPRYAFPAIFNGSNYIYVFGGITDAVNQTELATVYRYSISAKSWSAMASLPVAVAGSGAAMGPDGKFYVVGGTSGGAATDVVQIYDPTTNTWAIGTPLPEALNAAAVAVDSMGRLLVMGGEDSDGNDLGDVWRSQQLNVADTAPVITQYPSTSAVYLTAYLSSINATGSPPPTYALVSGPAGMQVDYFSGAITWTPQGIDQIGSNPVTIQAANYAGLANWSFDIIVPNPPPTPVTNLEVTGVTEDSVSLSWSPEDPTVGPVTYRVWLRHVLHDPKGSGSTVWYTQIGNSTTQTSITIGGLPAGLAQSYYVTASGAGGTSGYAGVAATTLPAPAPANLRVTGLTSTTVTLAWDAPTNGLPLASYRLIGVYDGVFVQYPLDVLNISGTAYTVAGLSAGTSILWGVAALDNAGNVSSYTYLPSLVTNPVPVAPAVCGCERLSTGGFQITSAMSGSTMQTVLIEATTNPADPNSWVQIGSLMPTANPFTFTDADAANYPARFYRIVAP